MENTIQYVIDLQKLKFGDIILMKTYGDYCQRIRDRSGSNFSHAMIYKGYYSCLESADIGVISINPQRMAFSHEDDAAIFRLKDQTDIGRLVKGLQYASEIVGTEYASIREVYKSLTLTSDEALERRRQFCTRFVAQIYDKSDISVVANPDYCSPAEIENSPILKRVNVLKVASAEELEIAKEHGMDSYQAQVTEKFLKNARKVAPKEDFQNFHEIDNFLQQHPDKNDELNRLLHESEYLELGDIEMDKNPHHYDFLKFVEHFGMPNAINISAQSLVGEIVLNSNFEFAYLNYQKLFEETSLSYFESLAKCYKQQREFSSKRLEIFKKLSAIYLAGGIVDETNYELFEAVKFALIKLVAEQKPKSKSSFKVGDSVMQKSGGPSMKIEGFEINKLTKTIDVSRAICTWHVKGKLKRKTFSTFDLIYDKPFFTYTAIDS